MAKRVFIVLLLLVGSVGLWGQESPVDRKSRSRRVRPVREMRAWTRSSMTAQVDTVDVDTSFVNYYDHTRLNRYSIANSYNGSPLSPLESKIYFDRTQKTAFLFSRAYDPYVITPGDVVHYNTKVPYSQIEYRSGGASHRKEDEINFHFTGNTSKRTNLGLSLSYLSPYGEYANQQAKDFNGSLWASYHGLHYFCEGSAMVTTIKVHENGGLSDPSQFSSESKILARDYSTRLSEALSVYRYYGGRYHHGYSWGVEREVPVGKTDSTTTIVVPVTTLSHTLELDGMEHAFRENSSDTSFFQHTYWGKTTRDSSALFNIKNTLSVTFEEQFNKLGFGITAFAYNEVQRYTHQLTDSTYGRDWRSTTYVGGVLQRERGKYFRFRVLGDVAVVGYKLGEFKVDGTMKGRIPAGKDTISIYARTYVRNEHPDYYLQHYRSNHFQWDNAFKKTYRFYAGGGVEYAHRLFDVKGKVGFENLTRRIYFDTDGLPVQHDGNVQVLSADVEFNLHLKHFGLENHAIYQQSSSQTLPLPALTLYENIYAKARLFRVLDLQVGMDMRYHTSYYAPLYQPATGQFCLQRDQKIGNYPVLSAYVNCKLKSVRFYVELSHFNYWFSNYKYYSMPGYPLNGAQFKYGISWSFFD